MKSILCIVDGSESGLGAVRAAFVLGKANAARICFLHISSNPSAYVGLYGEGIIASGEIIAAIEKDNKRRLEQAKKYVGELAAQYSVPLALSDIPAHHASASFKHIVGDTDEIIATYGRLSDLVVISKSAMLVRDMVTPAIFSTGRPVLLMPTEKNIEWQDKVIAVAWDGGLESARALYNALPMVSNAEKFYVLSAQESGKKMDMEAQNSVLEYLRAHGITAQAIVVAAGNRSVPEALLMRAKELGADALVMGAYGHSMLREIIFGGVTEYMLEKSQIPLLLSH